MVTKQAGERHPPTFYTIQKGRTASNSETVTTPFGALGVPLEEKGSRRCEDKSKVLIIPGNRYFRLEGKS